MEIIHYVDNLKPSDFFVVVKSFHLKKIFFQEKKKVHLMPRFGIWTQGYLQTNTLRGQGFPGGLRCIHSEGFP